MRLTESSPDVLLSASVVMMDDKKRPALHDHETGGPPSKRQATLNGARKAHPDADMPWKDDIDRYQKDAILRQMHEYKREVKLQEAQLAELNKRATHHDEHLRVLDTWFDQDHLASRSAEIHRSISDLNAKLPMAQIPEVSQLQQRISELLASEKVCSVELKQVQTERDQIQSRLESASLRYMRAEKKLDRARSTIVAKVENLGSGGAGDANTGPTDTPDRSTAISKESSAPSNGAGVGVEALFEADMARKEALAVTETVKEQLARLTEENESLTTQLTTLKIKFSSFSDDDLSKTELYKQLKSQYEDVVKRFNDLEARSNQIREENVKLRAEQTAFKIQVESEARTNMSDLESQLRRNEATLARIRSARDELFSQLAVKQQADEVQRNSAVQFEELAKIREERIKALESEGARLRLEISDSAPGGLVDSEIESLPLDELQQKYQNLQGQYKMLSIEIQSMGVAYQKAHTLASKKTDEGSAVEEKVARLQAEKSKADQKYFATMKAKDHQDSQLKALQLQNQKSSEIVSQLKDVESATKQVAVNLEQQLTESRSFLTQSLSQAQLLQQQLNERQIALDGLKAQNADLVGNFQSKDQNLIVARKLQRESETAVESLRTRTNELEKLTQKLKSQGASKGEEEESEMLRKLALCTVCRSRFKNTALRLCGHVFCKECVDDRTRVRLRNCPSCNKAFGANDMMTIHL
ncbi:MAG: E3 ubiquitin-protein ligase bre1 [Vezdaea aestivalis]|nr:MAG: E3 ubiquitin-protein ligase bre1 [Vezdaea aestivalis]